MDIEITSLVICDEVRREISHKDIIIGAYGNGMTVHSLPSLINLSLWVEFQAKKRGNIDIFLRIVGPSQKQPTDIKIGMEIGREVTSQAIYTPPMQVLIEREGSIKIYARTRTSSKLELIKSMNVAYTPLTGIRFDAPTTGNTQSTPKTSEEPAPLP